MPIDMDRRQIVVSDARVTASLRWHLDTPPEIVLAFLNDIRDLYLADVASRQTEKK